VDFTVTSKGPTFDSLIRDTTRDLKAANRKAGRELAKVGKAAMGKGAPRMMGKKLSVKGDVHAWPDRCDVEFHPAAGQAGAWQIVETGRTGGYLVKPRRRKALAFGGRFAMSAHPNPVTGKRAWSKAVQRLVKVTDKTVHDVYDEALDV
jgi:hypothetical protein